MTPKQKHVTFDLETLGNSYNAPIVQIAAVKFNLQGEILNSFSRNIQLDKELNPFTINWSTLKWWFNQDKKVIDSVFNNPLEVGLESALISFLAWCSELPNGIKFWSHSTFDPVILKNAYDKINLPCPIHFRDFVDIRTLNLLVGDVDVGKNQLPHDALSDSIHQAKYISKMLRKLYNI